MLAREEKEPNAFLELLCNLVSAGHVRISEHGYDELAEDGLKVKEIVESICDAVLVESYPDYPKGPCALLLQRNKQGAAIHVVWGVPKGHERPAVLVIAYHPDPKRWDKTFRRRLIE